MFKRIVTFSLLDLNPYTRLSCNYKSLFPNLLVKGIRTNLYCMQHNHSPYSISHPFSFNDNGKRFCSSDQKIYTKTGDSGTSSLHTGERRPKDDVIFNILGNIDELSSFLGSAKEYASEKNHDYVEQLERIQCILQDIGTLIATPIQVKNIKNEERKERVEKKIRFSKRHILELETWIDQHTETLPPLTNFILPGGGRISASLHICRTVCRRAERSIVSLVTDQGVDKNVIVYLNRLSDFLFTVARYATILDGKKETIYIRPKPIKTEKEKLEAKEKG